MLDSFKHYYRLAKMKQEQKFQGGHWLDEDINDDLINKVPIYDVVNRRFAAFSSFTEAVYHKENDPKGNGMYFKSNTVPKDINFATLCYLFRLCGSGINYIPAKGEPWGSHGFGNFWIVDLIRKGYYRRDGWIDYLPQKNFCDVKGYMLPMISGGMYNFIGSKRALRLVDHVWSEINLHQENDKYEIHEVVNIGNQWLLERGFKRQNFVLCAFAMDLAEYFPDLVDPNSRVLVGSNARKCLKLIFPTRSGMGSNLDTTNEALEELCEITGNHSKKYDMEDVACDFIRYIQNFQSPAHIESNKGIVYENSL